MLSEPNFASLKAGATLLIDKPYKWTSFDAINLLKTAFRIKIGHCGTLDPLATGLLICCTGSFTKKISEFSLLPKEYTGIFQLGAVTPTYDLESEPMDFKPFEHITDTEIFKAIEKFTGDILQTPPAHSAIKQEGKRAYELARSGETLVLKSRPVTIGEFEITKIAMPEVHVRILCSTGTYIRSLAQDVGKELGCGAYLKELRRTKIGNFKADNARTPQQWIDFIKSGR